MLTSKQIKQLREHRYSCVDQSYLDELMQPFWNGVVALVPLSVAPNALTLFGLLVNVGTTVTLLCFSPTAREPAPGWVYLLSAFGLFTYQTFDAIDGKQARRTHSSSPLGELFDHGCDSISTAFLCLTVCAGVGLGEWPVLMFWICAHAATLFYLTHWQTFVTGTMTFAKFDVTESQYTAMSFLLVSACFSLDAWSAQIPLLDVEMRYIPVVICIGGGVIAVWQRLTVILDGGVGKNGSTVANTSIVFPLLPLLSFLAPFYYLSVLEESEQPNPYYANPCLFTLLFGLVASKISNRLIVAHMTRSPMDLWDEVLLGPATLCAMHYFHLAWSADAAMWMALVYTIVVLVLYCCRVSQEICRALNIYCFQLGSRTSV